MIDLSDRDTCSALVTERHILGGESLRSIERSLGIGKTTLCAWCKRHGIPVRSKSEQAKITNRLPEVVAKRAGVNHWCYGKARPDSSARMIARNPTRMAGVKARAASSKAASWRDKPTAHESLLLSLLAGNEFAFQYAVGPYVLDFAFPRCMVGVELDGKVHDSAARKASDLIRDKWLIERGWKIIRLRQKHLRRPEKFLRVLVENVPNLQIVSALPASGRQYRVLIRDVENPTGRQG